MLMQFHSPQRRPHHLLICLFMLAAVLPRFCSDMVRDVETAGSLYQSLTATGMDEESAGRDSDGEEGELRRGRHLHRHTADDAGDAALGSTSSRRTEPGRSRGGVDERQQRRIVRHYRLLNRCSSKHLRVTSRRVDARAQHDDIYAELRVVSDSFGSHVRIQSAPSLGFICFNKHGRLIVKQSGRERNCVFQELQTVDHYTEFRSAANTTWFIGFNKRGQRLSGDSWPCLPHQLDDQPPLDRSCDQMTSADDDLAQSAPYSSRHRLRHSRHHGDKRWRRLLQCRQFIKTNVRSVGGTYDVSRPATSFAGERLDFRRLYARLAETNRTGSGSPTENSERDGHKSRDRDEHGRT